MDVLSDFDNNPSDGDDDIEVCALSEGMHSKIPKKCWVGDTGATSHMTDHRRLFRGALTDIKRRPVKVGGGMLYSRQRGTAIMRVDDGYALVSDALYVLVPDLGVNLLPARKMC